MSKEKNVPADVQEDQRDRKMSKGELVSYGLRSLCIQELFWHVP